MSSSLQLIRLPILAALAVAGVLVPAAQAQCLGGSGTCTSLSLKLGDNAAAPGITTRSSSTLSQADTGEGEYNITLYNRISTKLPAKLPPGNYAGWCVTASGHNNASKTFRATTTPPSVDTSTGTDLLGNTVVGPYKLYTPVGSIPTGTGFTPVYGESPLNLPSTWSKINYVLNHKSGYTIADVQTVIWKLTNGYSEAMSAAQTTLYNAALQNDTYVPPAGGVMMVLLISDFSTTPTDQHMIVEVRTCGQIGDRVWQDALPTITGDGLQDATQYTNFTAGVPADYFLYTQTSTSASGKFAYRYTENGLNNVRVQLLNADGTAVLDANGQPLVAVTGFSPRGYPYLPWNSQGFYQFTGLCDGTYQVKIDRLDGSNSTVLAGLTESPADVGAPTQNGWNSRKACSGTPQVCASTTLPNPTTGSMIDETMDFGYAGVPAIQVNCPVTTTGRIGVFFDSWATASGGQPGANGSYTFSMSPLPPPSGLTFDSTGRLHEYPNAAGDFTYTVTATDSRGTSATSAACRLHIDPGPLGLSCQAGVISMVGYPYTSTLMASGGATPYTFSVIEGSLPAGLTLNSSSGAITGTPSAGNLVNGPDQAVLVKFRAQVVDSAGSTYSISSQAPCGITVRPPITVACATINIVQDNTMKPVTLTAKGGSGSGYQFSATGLPAGVTLSASGVLSGKPTAVVTQPTTYNIEITIVDGEGYSSKVTCLTIVVNPKPSANCVAITAVNSVKIADTTISGQNGNGGPYTYSASGLPAGLSIDPNTGIISGTPNDEAKVYQYTITITDRDGYSGTSTCTIEVFQYPSMSCLAPANSMFEKNIFGTTLPLTLSGGVGGLTVSVVPGGTVDPIAAGLSLNVTNGILSGAPNAIGSFSLAAKDSLGNVAPGSCSYTIVAPPSLTCLPTLNSLLQEGIPGSTLPPTVSGGIGGYTYSVASGAFNPLIYGLSVNPTTGVVSGTPTASGSFSLLVTDSVGGVSASCPYTIVPKPTLTCATGRAGEVGADFNASAPTMTGGYGKFTFSLDTGDDPASLGLTLNTLNGAVTGKATKSGAFTIKATDELGRVVTGSCPYTVSVAPTLACAGVSVTTVGASVNTSAALNGGFSPFTFSFTGDDPATLGLTLNPTTGAITGTATKSGSFNIKVTDSLGVSATAACPFVVNVAPTISCGAGATTILGGVVNYTPTVSGGTAPYVWSLASGSLLGLTLDPATGVVTGTATAVGGFSLQVQDAAGVKAVGSCGVTVYDKPSAPCVAITAINGMSFSQQLSGQGGAGPGTTGYTFSLTGSYPAWLSITPSGMLSGTPTATGTFSYTVQVKDKDGNIGTSTCSITVIDAPSATCVVVKAITGVPFSATLVGTGGTGGSYTFTLISGPQWLSVSPNGVLSGTPTESGSFTYSVQVKDKDNNVGTMSCSVTVNVPPTATCVSIVAVQGMPITPVSMAGSGGVGGPYTFSATGLPNGLTMASNGTISGTPTVSGTFNYTVTVKDAAGNTSTVNCSVTVNPPPTATCVSITAVLGMSITPVTLVGSGGVGGPYTFSATGLPAGLTMSTTGTISGVPMVAGSFSYTVTVTDKNGNSGTINCSVSVSSPTNVCGLTWGYWKNHVSAWPVQTLTMGGKTYTNAELWAILNAPVAGDANLNLGHQLIAAKLNVLNGTMQSTDGGAIADADNLLAGYSNKIPLSIGSTTTAGIQMVSIASRLDLFNQDGQAQPGCTNGPAPALNAVCAGSTGQVGVPYSSSIAVAGGFAPYTFAVTGGSLPAGLTLNPLTGAITGTPTTAGTFNYSITVTDSSYNSGDGTTVGSVTTNCSITIAPAPTATCASITAAQNSPITPVTLSATGGAGGPYTFTASGLPAGLTMSSTGTISGTPTVSGTFAYTVTIKDMKGNVGTINCSVTVSPQVVCAPTTFDLTGGNSATNGTPGNTKIFTAPNGIQVKASAWSRDKSTGAWAAGWLGSYAPGLGVTDTSEDGSDPSHRVDNVGSRINYVLFEFSAPVVVNRVYLSYVGADSDITAWIGTASNPFANHLTLSDSLLAGYNKEANSASNGSDRWADINGTNLSGNVLVIAASTTDLGTFDEFKIAQIETSCNGQTVPTPTASCVVINAVQGSAITPIKMAGSGGAGGPYTFSAVGLPAGLTMASDGTISGTPTVSGTFNYTVTVKDKNGVAGTVNCSLTVSPAPVCAPTTFDFTGSTNSASSGTYGNMRTFTAPNGIRVNVTAWARNKSTGVWSKAFLGQYSPGLGVTDNTETGADPSHRVDNDGQVNYVLFEFSAPVNINRVYLDYIGGDSDMAAWVGNASNPFANHLTLSDSVLASIGNYEEDLSTLTSGGRWATLNNGFLQGNVLVIAAKPSDADDYFKIAKLETVCASAVTGSCVSVTAVQGVAITPVTMTAANGTGGPYTFAASGLPAGLTMSNSGTISGTPTVSGTFAYTVTVTDNTGNTAVVNCSVIVASLPTTTCASITAVQGSPISSVTLVGSGGAGGPYTFSASGLPAGLTMSSSGTISGTPTVSGTFNYTITVTDKNGNKGTVNCSVTVTAPAPVVCGLTWGYWKNHVSVWPSSALPMILGKQSYSSSELQAILAKSVAGDQSIEMAHQLIAAKFNVAMGTPIATANGAIASADSLLSQYSTKMGPGAWYGVSASSTIGAQMVSVANSLNTFNSDGKAQPGCTMYSGGCSGTIGNWVWVDANINGIQDLGEAGLSGVTVKLFDANHNLLQTVTTDANGQYQFTGLCAGTYIVEVTPPAGYTATLVGAAAAGGDRDSNATPTTVVLTTNNSSNMDTDFGFVKTTCSGSIGDLVWKDSNGNGIQDAGEPGLPGVTLNLLWSGYTLTAVTDANGNYKFTGLCGGSYTVSVTAPTGYTATGTLAGADRSKDSNVSGATVTLSTSTSSDVTIDFGFKAVTSSASGYTTYTQGGWGAKPTGNNPGAILQSNFPRVYPNGVTIGGSLKLTFSSSVAVQGFLPQGGTAAVLALSDANPTTSAAGVFAGQVLALQLSVDFSTAGITKSGLGALKLTSGKLAGQTVSQVLATANSVLGGGAPPSGITVADLNSIVDSINNNYDGGTTNKGYCQ